MLKTRRDSNAKYQALKREKERQQNAEENTNKNDSKSANKSAKSNVLDAEDEIVAAESTNPNEKWVNKKLDVKKNHYMRMEC